jgi:hypothetical protein
LNLPQLTAQELIGLAQGERVQKQTRDGRAGNGIVVVEVDANRDSVFNTLRDFEK